MTLSVATLPPLLQDYLTRHGFWAGAADYDFWYAVHAEEWYWLHVRRLREVTLALSLFVPEEGGVEMDLYNLSRAPVHGLRATIANTALMTLQRDEPGRPLVAMRLRSGASARFTLPRHPTTLPDEWLAEVMERLHGSLNEQWHLLHAAWPVDRYTLATLWPEWAGSGPLG